MAASSPSQDILCPADAQSPPLDACVLELARTDVRARQSAMQCSVWCNLRTSVGACEADSRHLG